MIVGRKEKLAKKWFLLLELVDEISGLVTYMDGDGYISFDSLYLSEKI